MIYKFNKSGKISGLAHNLYIDQRMSTHEDEQKF